MILYMVLINMGLVIFYPTALWSVVLLTAFSMSVLLALLGTIAGHIMLSMKHQVRHVSTHSSYSTFHKYLLERYIIQAHKVTDRLPIIFGRSVDLALQDLLYLIVEDLVSSWFKDISFSISDLHHSIKKEIWQSISRLHDRLITIDETKLIAVDIVTKITSHFEKIRSVQASSMLEQRRVFYLSNHLMSHEKELNYLRKLSELLLSSLFSKSLISHSVNRNLLIEISACKVFFPLVVLVTDSHYINIKILDFMTQFVRSHGLHQQSCALAESYQEFIQLIQNSFDLNQLKQIRYSIVTEIMQATTIQNLKKSKDLDKEKCQSNSKKLKRYLGQLSFAKAQCEARIRALGCMEFHEEHYISIGSEKQALPLEKVLESSYGKTMFWKFLENCKQEYLLVYWAAVEELRATDKTNLHQIAAEIYYTFIHSPTAPMKVEKSVRRRMESFLLGDSGPEMFYDLQDSVIEILKKKFYPAFLSTEYFTLFMQNIDIPIQDQSGSTNLYVEDRENESVMGQSGYSRNKLTELQEKLNNKSQALEALKISLKPESRVLCGLQREVEHLEGEKRQLEAHMNRTEVWSEHLGKWRTVVQSAEISDDKETPQFVLVVHALEDEYDSEAISTGWVVLRKLSEFIELHRKLLQVWNGVRHLELPTQGQKFLFGKPADRCNLEKAKQQIQRYLEFVMLDERLNASEALYSFLSPGLDCVKATNSEMSSPKKSRFSLSTLFKTSNQHGNSDGSRDSDDEELSLFDEDIRLCSIEGKDAIGEPLYALLGEIFDLRGVFRWLRRTLITFVQITYGRTINKQIGETMAWLVSQQMLHYYVELITQSWWPHGVFVSKFLCSEEERIKIRLDAKSQFVNNIPEVLTNLVGQQNARRGALKIFEVLQEHKLNKQMFYELLELVVYEIFPELKNIRKNVHSK